MIKIRCYKLYPDSTAERMIRCTKKEGHKGPHSAYVFWIEEAGDTLEEFMKEEGLSERRGE